MISPDEYRKCVLCDNHQIRLIRHFVNHHKLVKEVAYLFRAYCYGRDNNDNEIDAYDEKSNFTFKDISKYVTSRQGGKTLKLLDTSAKRVSAMDEVTKLYETRKENKVDDNKKRLISALRAMMKHFSGNANNAKNQRNNIATATKHLFQYSIDAGNNCTDIIDLFTDDSLNSLVANANLGTRTKDNYLCELNKVLDFLDDRCDRRDDVHRAVQTVSELRASLRENVPNDSPQTDSANLKPPKRPSTKFDWNITAKQPKLQPTLSSPLKEANRHSIAPSDDKPKKKTLFNKDDDQLMKEFYIVLYRQIVDNHTDGVNKRNFYHELHRFDSSDERLLSCKQRVIDLPNRSALDKLHTCLRSSKFQKAVSDYDNKINAAPLFPPHKSIKTEIGE